ncbi:ATP-binding protein [Streptomyces apocyni]|uniref:ATP-binding protein n=1 Tax=Streptomyces apocyni TaxID=2654677 RepID=UPI0012E9C8D0|nr:ATP-binding protein [Streptomyces apocyni]
MSITSLCTAAGTGATTTPVPPSVDNLSYSLGLPGGAYCAGLVRGTVRSVLREHGLRDAVALAELVVSELLACAYRFTPERDVSLSLRCRYETLRVTVFDQHPVHPHGRADECRERRLRSLEVLAALAKSCRGEHGIADIEPPLPGSKLWAAFPLKEVYRYALL